MPFRAHINRTHKEKVQLALEVCAYLNELLEADQLTLHRLVETRFRCNSKLLEHPTAQVDASNGTPMIGLLGIVNGLIGVDDNQWGYVSALYGSNHELQKFVLSPRQHVDGQVQETEAEALEGS